MTSSSEPMDKAICTKRWEFGGSCGSDVQSKLDVIEFEHRSKSEATEVASSMSNSPNQTNTSFHEERNFPGSQSMAGFIQIGQLGTGSSIAKHLCHDSPTLNPLLAIASHQWFDRLFNSTPKQQATKAMSTNSSLQAPFQVMYRGSPVNYPPSNDTIDAQRLYSTGLVNPKFGYCIPANTKYFNDDHYCDTYPGALESTNFTDSCPSYTYNQDTCAANILTTNLLNPSKVPGEMVRNLTPFPKQFDVAGTHLTGQCVENTYPAASEDVRSLSEVGSALDEVNTYPRNPGVDFKLPPSYLRHTYQRMETDGTDGSACDKRRAFATDEMEICDYNKSCSGTYSALAAPNLVAEHDYSIGLPPKVSRESPTVLKHPNPKRQTHKSEVRMCSSPTALGIGLLHSAHSGELKNGLRKQKPLERVSISSNREAVQNADNHGHFLKSEADVAKTFASFASDIGRSSISDSDLITYYPAEWQRTDTVGPGVFTSIGMLPRLSQDIFSSLTNPYPVTTMGHGQYDPNGLAANLPHPYSAAPEPYNPTNTHSETQGHQFDAFRCSPLLQYHTESDAIAAAAMTTNFQVNLNYHMLPTVGCAKISTIGQHASQQLHYHAKSYMSRHRVGPSAVTGIPSGHYGHRNIIDTHSLAETEYNPRELEAFSERFKQRRIKLGVTQADVGKALGNLKIAGVGSLSQSTICRFESLTLSHNNMVALKPVLQAWLEEAEAEAAERLRHPDVYDPEEERRRKRTSITDAEKRSLEAFFSIQPRPSSEKISQIADKLNLKKNVVRVWFCNQRQKQKRMKFSTLGLLHHSSSRM